MQENEENVIVDEAKTEEPKEEIKAFDPKALMKDSISPDAIDKIKDEPADEGVKEEVKAAPDTELDDYVNELDVTMKSINKDYSIPEELKTGLNKEGKALTTNEKFNVLAQEIANNTSFDEDEFVTNYLEAKSKGVTTDEYIATYNSHSATQSLPPRDYYELKLKERTEAEKTGWTDTDIKTFLDGKSKVQLDLDVLEMKKQDQQTINAKLNTLSANKQNELKAEYDKQEEINKQVYDNYIELNKDATSINGIEFDETLRNSFFKEIPTLLTRDPKTGFNALEDWLSADDNLLAILPSVYLNMKGKSKSYSSDIKEAAKAKIEEKLDSKPEKTKSAEKSIKDFDPKKMRGEDH